MTGTLWLVLLISLVVVVAAANWWLGLWSNLITGVNLLLAGMVATSLYQNLANSVIRLDSSWVHVVDFTMLWVLFVFSFVVLRSLTEVLTRYRLRFHPVLEMVGRTLGSLAVGILFVCFASFTLQLAPFSPIDSDAFGNKGIYPESAWVGMMDFLSNGSLAADGESASFGKSGRDNRRMGTVDQYQAMGDSIRASINKSTNLRAVKVQN